MGSWPTAPRPKRGGNPKYATVDATVNSSHGATVHRPLLLLLSQAPSSLLLLLPAVGKKKKRKEKKGRREGRGEIAALARDLQRVIKGKIRFNFV